MVKLCELLVDSSEFWCIGTLEVKNKWLEHLIRVFYIWENIDLLSELTPNLLVLLDSVNYKCRFMIMFHFTAIHAVVREIWVVRAIFVKTNKRHNLIIIAFTFHTILG